MHRRRATLLLALAALGAALALAEAVTRWIDPPGASVIEYPCIYEPDARFGFRYQPGSTGRLAGDYEIRMNSLGFHDDEPLPPDEVGLRVLAVGDSFTAALGVFRSETWTAVLERELRTRGHPRADVVNLGIDGTGTDVHRDVLRAYLPRFRPDVVLLAFFANDVPDVVHGRFSRECHRGFVLSYQTQAQRRELRRRVDAHLERGAARWLFAHSRLARLVVFALEGPRNLFRLRFVQPSRAELGLDAPTLRARRARVGAVFDDLEAIARDCDCRFRIVPVPGRGDLGGSLRAAGAAVGNRDLRILDVLPAMDAILREDGRRRDALHFVHDAHLNSYGNEVFGRAIARSLE